MITTFSSKLFNYDQATGMLTAEASDLQPHGDVGMEFWVKSERTGRSVLFEYHRSLRTKDADQEVHAWEYRPAQEYKDLQQLKLVVWND